MSTTTLFPCNDSGSREEYGPVFPASAGAGMLTQLREAQGFNFAKPKTVPKKFIKSAEGSATKKSVKVKTSAKPKNLRTKSKKKKVGAFGEAYEAPSGNAPKGVRVAESRGVRISSFGEGIEGGPGSGRHADGGQQDSGGRHGFIAFHKGRRVEVHADTLLQARDKVAKQLGVKKPWEIAIKIAEKDGQQVTHSTSDL